MGIATYEIKPRLNRLNGVATVIVQGGQEPEFEVTAGSAQAPAGRCNRHRILDAVRRSNLIDSPGLVESKPSTHSQSGKRAGATPEEIAVSW